MPKTRVCRDCEERFKITDFHKTGRGDQRRKDCKHCRKKYLKTLSKREKKLVKEKKCGACKETKVYTRFPQDRRASDGRYYKCRVCNNKGLKKYRETEEGKKVRRECEIRYRKKFYATPHGKLSRAVRGSIWSALKKNKGAKGGDKTWKALPYNVEELMAHLEAKFMKGMTWDNYGEWHVDHVVAHCNFKYKTLRDPEFLLCWSLTNLQPMWAPDNISKGTLSMHEYHEKIKNEK